MKKKISILIISLIIVLASLGLSYAYWKITLMGDKGNNVTSGCFNIEMINQKDEITLGSTFPITDAEGLKLKPFSFTLKNTCTIFAHYYVNMEMLEGTTLNSKFVAVRVNNEAINTLDTYKVASTTINTSTESRTIAEGYLGADEEVDYTVSFWVDEDATIDDDVMNKVFKSKIVINSEPGKYDPVSAGYDTLHDAILANEYQTTPEIAKTKIANKQEVDLSNTAPVIKWVEKVGESTTREVAKPAESVIEVYNKDTGTGDRTNQASNLTLNDTKLKLYTTMTFNSETGRYSMGGAVFVDPTTLDFTENNKCYYFIDEYVSYDNKTNKLYTWYVGDNEVVYKITGATKINSTTKWNNIIYDSVTYKLSTTTLTEIESEIDSSDKGLYQALDDYGTTYYYRGNVKNNNVYFAGFNWQIVRLNGDGSIRLIYNGNKKTSSDKIIDNQLYQFNSLYSSPIYVGYMYGSQDATTFFEAHSNINNSKIKNAVDNWYKVNVVDKGYNKYVSTSVGFCGDRSINNNDNGDGIQTITSTKFASYDRLIKNKARFTCQESLRDLYTTTDSNIGNKALIYPVGLITYDEVMFAGMNYKGINKLSYIYSNNYYWTMTPAIYNATSGNSVEILSSPSGIIYLGGVNTSWGSIRPVINLKSDVKITGGTGTANDPFVVDTYN